MRLGPILAAAVAVAIAGSCWAAAPPPPGHPNPRLQAALRQPTKNGWIFVHLEGDPATIGYQHGYLLAPEIADTQRTIAAVLAQDTKKDWAFFRSAAEQILWPRIESEYREELQGIVEGLQARRVKLDLWDIVALNAWLELGAYYVPWLQKTPVPVPERCSAFIATGSYTKSGEIVFGHNAWTGYAEGARWNIIFDIQPTKGFRLLMDGMAGLIHSGDDFVISASGLMITETTISHFAGFDPSGIAEFVRARKAAQYADSIDSFARIIVEGNNGGYANNWLLGDRKTGEIASLELGLKNVTLQRTTDGYFAGSNTPVNPKLIAEETTFDPADKSSSPNARRIRWEQLMAEHKGKIDVALARTFLGDHLDSFTGQTDPNERTLCGHIDLSPRGLPGWVGPYAPAGAVQAKVADAKMAEQMRLEASMGHSCGLHFRASAFLRRRPAYRPLRPHLKDLPGQPWTMFTTATSPDRLY
jgi:hypothetical protein